MSNVGFATLSVIPSLKGGAAALTGQMSGPASVAGTQAGGLFGTGFGGALGGVLAGGAAVAGIGAGLAAIGGSFDDAFDTIRTETGATGRELAGLETVFRGVVSDVPTDFGSASTAISGLQQRLHLTGPALRGLSGQMLELSRITETDLEGNVDSVTRSFGDWGVATGRQSGVLDQFFRASQLSGTSVSDLASNVTNFGSPLRQLGFGLTDSIAMFSRFDAEGVNTSTVMAGMRQAVKNFGSGLAEEKTGVTDFQDVVAGVKDGTFDLTDAMTVFGARAGTDVFKAIQEGRFELGRYSNQIANGSDTILGAAEDTNDWRESLELLKNRALVLIEPLATRVFDTLGQGAAFLVDLADAFGQNGLTGVIDMFSDRLALIPTPIKIVAAALFAFASPIAAVAAGVVYAYTHFEGFRNVVNGVASWLTGTAWPAIRNFAVGVADAFGELVGWVRQRWAAISEAIGHVLTVVKTIIAGHVAVVMGLWHTFGDEILSVIRAAWTYVQSTVRNAINFVAGIIDTVLAVINGDWGKAWDGIKQALSAVWSQMKAVVRLAWAGLKALLGAGLSALKALWRGAWTAIKAVLTAAWNGIKAGARAGITAVIGFLRDLPGRAVNALTRMPAMLLNAGRAGLRGLWDGMRAVWTSARTWVGQIPEAALRAIGAVGRILYEKGRDIIQGIWDGMKSLADDVWSWLTDWIGSLSDLGGSSVTVTPVEERSTFGGKGPGPAGGAGVLLNDRPSPLAETAGLTAAAPPAEVVLRIEGAGPEVLRFLRKAVRTEGGDVQVVLGS